MCLEKWMILVMEVSFAVMAYVQEVLCPFPCPVTNVLTHGSSVCNFRPSHALKKAVLFSSRSVFRAF